MKGMGFLKKSGDGKASNKASAKGSPADQRKAMQQYRGQAAVGKGKGGPASMRAMEKRLDKKGF